MSHFVEKVLVPVRLALRGDDPTQGSLWLAPHAELHLGPETLLERLNQPTRVLPFRRATDGAVTLLQRTQIEWVEPLAGVDPGFVQRGPYLATREEDVVVRLGDGKTLAGVLALEMPDDSNRVSDFLNTPEDFFVLRTPAGLRILNKSGVLEVRLTGGAKRAKAA